MSFASSKPFVDLTADASSADERPVKKAKHTPAATVSASSVAKPIAPQTVQPATAAPKVAKAPKAVSVPKKSMPHVLIWVCHHGPGQSKKWTKKSLNIVGVYRTKEEAEQKKLEVMGKYEQCGHGDILVGGSWDDEIDLVVRPAEECTL
jgi:hypothetical protein